MSNSQVMFGRYDFVSAQKTVALDKNTTVYLPNGFGCKISAAGMKSVEYTNKETVFETIKPELGKREMPRTVTVSLFRKNTILEMPFKRDNNGDLTVLSVALSSPEKTEELLQKLPHNKYVEVWSGGEQTSFLFAHYDADSHTRGLADFVHDELFDTVTGGAKKEEIEKRLENFGMKLLDMTLLPKEGVR